MQEYKRQIVVIGGGAGGIYVSSVLSRLGYNVTLIDKRHSLGGDRLHSGCVPSKAFIKAAQAAHCASHAYSRYGIDCQVKVEFAKIQEYVNGVIAHMQKYDSPMRFKSYGVNIIYGNGHFVGDHMLSVDDKLIPAEKFIIATGSRPSIPNIEGLDQINYYTNENILSIPEQPKRLIILGGGTIGLEYAQAFVRLGTKVIVLEQNSQLMLYSSQPQIKFLKEILITEGIEFLTSIKINKIVKNNNSNNIELLSDSHDPVTGDALLIAVGREPEHDDLGLDLVEIAHSPHGIIVDEYLRTSKKNIYAIGDVIESPYKFTHVAEYHSRLVIDNIAFRKQKKVTYNSVPMVLFTDPEFAQVGLTEQLAKERNIRYKLIDYQLLKLDRAMINNEGDGSIRLLVKNNKLLGASILSPNASELIQELALAIDNKIPIYKIVETIHAYPTWSQMIPRAINKHFEPKLFSNLSKFYIRMRQFMD
ncbi:MAG: NAD(P)/FAD-dependent oxidoreductase [Gammaproteobacteria bacterium]|nr:NAD(P)/FAD-dependent oxidoreductase [Gammaproteobacteria bacterium]